ncbi:MAG: DUF434 domain-containing protein [Deltaproteobacteria bacterium]|nr:DUF434 domain-containing protein [Deltaproteobacteria bacterium]
MRDPLDESRFTGAALARVIAGAEEVEWLLGRGYPLASAVSFVGGRHQLDERQRRAIARSVAAAEVAATRRARALRPEYVAGRALVVDGFNVLVTVEVALGGGLALVGRDGALRDLAGMRGSHRVGDLTRRAIALVGARLGALAPASTSFLIDAPVSRSGELASVVRDAARGWPVAVEVELARDVDARVAAGEIAASSDAIVLDRAARWIPLSRWIVEAEAPNAFVVDFRAA